MINSANIFMSNGAERPHIGEQKVPKEALTIINNEYLITRYKIIYDVQHKEPKMIKEILGLEIKNIQRENPNFKMWRAFRKANEDGSVTFTLQLRHKLLV